MTHHPDQATGPGWDIFVAGPVSDVYVQALRPSRTTLRTAPGEALVRHLRTRVRFPPPPLVSRRSVLASFACSPGRLVLFVGGRPPWAPRCVSRRPVLASFACSPGRLVLFVGGRPPWTPGVRSLGLAHAHPRRYRAPGTPQHPPHVQETSQARLNPFVPGDSGLRERFPRSPPLVRERRGFVWLYRLSPYLCGSIV